MTGLEKEYYGIEAGLDFKVASFLNFKAIGTISDAKNLNNITANYMISKSAEVVQDKAYIKDMRESGTPLTVGSHLFVILTKLSLQVFSEEPRHALQRRASPWFC